jgi:hypothetical protein
MYQHEFRVKAGESITDAEFLLAEMQKRVGEIRDSQAANIVQIICTNGEIMGALAHVLAACRVPEMTQEVRILLLEHNLKNYIAYLRNAAGEVLREDARDPVAATIWNFIDKVHAELVLHRGEDKERMEKQHQKEMSLRRQPVGVS